jgi:hypothetical protein
MRIPLGPFKKNFLQKLADIFAAQGAPPVPLTPLANGKKVLNICLDTFGQ